ncbi:phospholipase D-like domain-containing protein [Pantoea stewartii]|uniref:phospholipase D-like domain-containing protein n=1 Tax=Pantoea stewartii TaxID=66269 RepID=UPI001EF06324|nr:phospholipase D-like domain-containing protein [Pantoea stewartii]
MKSVRVSLFILSAVSSISVSAGDNIAVGFSPGGSAQRLILNLIAGAGKTLNIAAYEFTSRPVADALISQSQRGVAVRLVADEKVSHDRYSLVSPGLPAGLQRGAGPDGRPVQHHAQQVYCGRRREYGNRIV